MTALQRFGAAVLVMLALVGIGAAGGAWWAADSAAQAVSQVKQDLATCSTGRGELEAQVAKQNAQVQRLQAEGQRRQEATQQAQATAQAQAAPEYAAAGRLLQERNPEPSCAAAIGLIDQELGL